MSSSGFRCERQGEVTGLGWVFLATVLRRNARVVVGRGLKEGRVQRIALRSSKFPESPLSIKFRIFLLDP